MSRRAAVYYHPFGGEGSDREDDPDLEEVLQEIRLRDLLQDRDRRRGDILMDSNERGLPDTPDQPYTDHGYRHNGIYIFDGTKITHLESNGPDDYGTIPEEYQVVTEFPPMYWSHVLNHNAYVPFDVRRHLGELNPQFATQIVRTDGRGAHIVYPFTGPDGQLYGIVDMEVERPSAERVGGFLREIQDEKWFQTPLPGIGIEDPISLPPGLSYERLLLHGSPGSIF